MSSPTTPSTSSSSSAAPTLTSWEEQSTYYPWSTEKNGFSMPSPHVGAVVKADATDTTSTTTTPPLFQPLSLRELTLKNRLVVSPMCTYSSEDGFFSDWHLVHLGSFALGGAGLVFTEATAVSPEGRITPNCTGIWKDEHKEKLSQIAKFVHAHGAAFGVQLAHAGRKGSTNSPFLIPLFGNETPLEKNGYNVVGPSAVPHTEGYFRVPDEMTVEQIHEVTQMHVDAAKRCLESGVDVIELHAAHGYLFSQFLSPLSNKRTDSYGGDFDGRVRFLLETVKAVREVWPAEKPLFLRLSCIEWVEDEPSWTIEQTIALSDLVSELGVDVLDCSSGGNTPKQKIVAGPAYQLPFAKAVAEHVSASPSNNLKVASVGALHDAVFNNEVVGKGEADLILIGRAFLKDPRWPQLAAEKLGVNVSYAPQYDWPRKW